MTANAPTVAIEPGSKEWHEIRQRCLVPVPGRFSALYYLCANVLDMREVVPMTYRAHWPLCLFLEGATGIPEIDSARVKMALYPRGTGKSTIGTMGRSVQLLLQHDGYAVGIANEKAMLAESFLGSIKMQFERNERLTSLFPERKPDSELWRQDQIKLTRSKPRRDPSVLATGVDGTVTGVHMNHWFLDDLISKEVAQQARRGVFTEIEKTNHWCKELQPLLTMPKRDPITVCATYWWAGDTYQWLEGDEENPGLFGHGEKRMNYDWNLRLPDGEWLKLRLYRRGEVAVFARSIRDETGNSWFPERLTNDELEMLELEDPDFFAGQYLLDPNTGKAAAFREDWLRYYALEDGMIRYRGRDGHTRFQRVADLSVLISLDPAFSKKRTAAKTAITVVGTNGWDFFLLEDFADRIGVYDAANKAIEFARKYRPHKVFVETIAGQAAVAEVLARRCAEEGLTVPIEELSRHSEINKTLRIYELEPYLKAGRFHVQPGQRNFLLEYRTFPNSAFRDVLDSLMFQRPEWERLTGIPSQPGGQGRFHRVHEEAMAKIRKAIGKGGGY